MWKTTRWSQILDAQQQNSKALEKLCKDYWPCIYKFADQRYRGFEIEDLVQDFFTKFLENKWIERVCKNKGKFRTFLITTFVRFVRDEHVQKQNRFENSMCSFITEEEINSFNCYWVENLLELTNQRMYEYYLNNDRCEYVIFRIYYYPPQSAFFRNEDIFSDVLSAHITKNTTPVDRLVYEQVSNGYSLSQALNKLIGGHCFVAAHESDYLFDEVDLKNKKFFIDELRKFFPEHKFTEHNITNVLNELIHNGNLAKQLNCSQEDASSVQQNRCLLENQYPQYIEKYSIKVNRKYFDTYYHNFVVPLFLHKPSYLQIAEHLHISKHHVEKAMKSSTQMYKELLRDEVSRYVCPQDIGSEIRYLQNLMV